MNITARSAYIVIVSLLILGTGVTSFAATKTSSKVRGLTAIEKKLVGSYRCRSYNVSGGGSDNCRLAPPIVLSGDGTYSMSSEKGTFSVKKKKLVLSKSANRGPGAFSLNPASLTFSYTYRGWKHVITYAREQKALAVAQPVEEKQDFQSESPVLSDTVPVDLTLTFPESDGSVAWVNVIQLVPQGETPASSSYRPESLAIQEGHTSTLYASFYGNKEIASGRIYDIYASSGFDSKKVGVLDLTAAKGLVKTVIAVISLGEAAQSPTPQSESTQKAEPCNQTIPRYAGGC